MIGSTELLIILGIVLLIFGAGSIPKLAKSLGKAKNEFEKGLEEGKKEVNGKETKSDKEKETKSK